MCFLVKGVICYEILLFLEKYWFIEFFKMRKLLDIGSLFYLCGVFLGYLSVKFVCI